MQKNTENPMADLLSRERCLQLSQYMIDGAALWINLDRFQQVNETFGYGGGDEVLGVIAQRLDNAIGDDAHLSHMGADEFVCLTFVQNQSKLDELVEQITGSIQSPLLHGDL